MYKIESFCIVLYCIVSVIRSLRLGEKNRGEGRCFIYRKGAVERRRDFALHFQISTLSFVAAGRWYYSFASFLFYFYFWVPPIFSSKVEFFSVSFPQFPTVSISRAPAPPGRGAPLHAVKSFLSGADDFMLSSPINLFDSCFLV